jgi:hypothetical protein
MPELGKHLTSVVMTPQTVAADGTLADTTPVVTLTTTIEELGEDFMPTHAEISPLNSVRQHNVIEDDAYAIRFSVFKVNDGTDPDKLKTAIRSADVFKLVYVEGTVTGGIKTTTTYGLRGQYSTGFQGKGKQIGTINFVCVDIGASSYSVATT